MLFKLGGMNTEMHLHFDTGIIFRINQKLKNNISEQYFVESFPDVLDTSVGNQP